MTIKMINSISWTFCDGENCDSLRKSDDAIGDWTSSRISVPLFNSTSTTISTLHFCCQWCKENHWLDSQLRDIKFTPNDEDEEIWPPGNSPVSVAKAVAQKFTANFNANPELHKILFGIDPIYPSSTPVMGSMKNGNLNVRFL
ncbi:hypothetical protein SEA_CAMERICO_4 [Gordonia phage Camerico]|nr:hypothetical protein SEA_CAMERICO_4 [Gordonia phage Camerico]